MADIQARYGVVKIDNSGGSLTAVAAGLAQKVSGLGVERNNSRYGGGLNTAHEKVMIGQQKSLDVTFTLYMQGGASNTLYRDLVAWMQTATPASRTVTVSIPAEATGNDLVTFEALPISIMPADLDDSSSDPLMYDVTVAIDTPGLAWTVQA